MSGTDTAVWVPSVNKRGLGWRTAKPTNWKIKLPKKNCLSSFYCHLSKRSKKSVGVDHPAAQKKINKFSANLTIRLANQNFYDQPSPKNSLKPPNMPNQHLKTPIIAHFELPPTIFFLHLRSSKDNGSSSLLSKLCKSNPEETDIR